MPLRYRQLKKRKDFFFSLISQKSYSVIHLQTVCSIDFQVLQIAKKLGVPVRIAHSQSSGLGNNQLLLNVMHKLCKPLVSMFATHCFACSTMAGKNLFGKQAMKHNRKYRLIHDGIYTDSYRFDSVARENTRKKLGISNEQILLGCIARYDPMKRHDFAVDVLNELCKTDNQKYHLLLIGDGGTKAKIEQMVVKYGLQRNVTFIRSTTNVPAYLSAMDVLVFPSTREGLSCVLVEAQCSGLPCIVTDQIPKESKLTENFTIMPVESPASKWKAVILSITNNEAVTHNRQGAYKTIQEQGYDISFSANQLNEVYASAYAT